MLLNKLFKSVLEQDRAPIVICDLEHTIVYMNPVAIERYHKDLTGHNLKKCHNEKSFRVMFYFHYNIKTFHFQDIFGLKSPNLLLTANDVCGKLKEGRVN